MQPIGVIQFGLGPIGKGIARTICEKKELVLVGGVDTNPQYIGKDLGDVIGVGPLGVPVKGSLSELPLNEVQVVVHTTQSYIPQIYSQLEEIIKLKLHIVSTTEELSFPFIKNKEVVEKLNNLAVENQVSVLGTGVNPGFLMDSLPLFLTSVLKKVYKIRILRLMDATKRRGPFQVKIGSGLTTEEFRRRVDEGTLGHVGLEESVYFVATSLGMKIARYTETIDPVTTDVFIKTDHVEVEAGKVRGLYQVGTALDEEGKELIKLEFNAFLDAVDPHDLIEITGEPSLKVIIPGGTPGDIATTSIAVNCIPKVLNAPRGLITMKDITLSHNIGSF